MCIILLYVCTWIDDRVIHINREFSYILLIFILLLYMCCIKM